MGSVDGSIGWENYHCWDGEGKNGKKLKKFFKKIEEEKMGIGFLGWGIFIGGVTQWVRDWGVGWGFDGFCDGWVD